MTSTSHQIYTSSSNRREPPLRKTTSNSSQRTTSTAGMSDYSLEQYREECPGDNMSSSSDRIQSRQTNPAYYPANQPRLPMTKPRRTSEGPDRPEDSPRSIVNSVVVNPNAIVINNQRTSRASRISAARTNSNGRQTSKSRYDTPPADYLESPSFYDSPSFYSDAEGLQEVTESKGPTGLAGSIAVVREPSMIVTNNNRRRITNNVPTRKAPSTRRLASVGVLQRSNTHDGSVATPREDSGGARLAQMRQRMDGGSNRSNGCRRVENLQLSHHRTTVEPPALVSSPSMAGGNLRRQNSATSPPPPPTRRTASSGAAPRRAAALSRQYSTGSHTSARSYGSAEQLQRRAPELPVNRPRVDSHPQNNNEQYSRPQQPQHEERYHQEPAPTTTPSQASNNSSTSTHSSTTIVEIQPGLEAPLRATEETLEAINMDYVTSQACLACNTELYCIADAQYYICPICRVVSPIFAAANEELPEGSRHGVGLGFTRDTLMDQRSQHQRQEQWRRVEAL